MPTATRSRAKIISGGSSLEAKRRRAGKGDKDMGRRLGKILLRTVHAFFDDNIARLGAALAFYTTIAVAPLLVLAVAAAGIVFDETSARQQVIEEIEHLAGAQASALIATVQNPAATTSGTIATLVGAATLAFGAFGVFQHLQDALNEIWHVKPPPMKGWWEFLRRRMFSLATVLVTGFLLLVSLVVSSLLSWFGERAIGWLGLPVYVLQATNDALSYAMIMVLFAMIFKLLPDTPVRWRHVWLGAAVTALLFTLGKSALAFYLAHSTVTSAYGAGGTLIALLLWCYYAAQIVFLGAEFTRVTAVSDGGKDFSPLDSAHRAKAE